MHITGQHNRVWVYVLVSGGHTLTTCIADLEAEHLTLSSGVIWTALNIDYPGHSYSHLGVFFGWSSLL